MDDQMILERVLAEFSNLAGIPRKSGHEQAVSNFLKERAESFGCTVIQDEKYNLIIDKPATPGLEDLPLVGMQAHMDMVCVAEPGVEYDPLTSPIKLVRDEKFLRAAGTTLGADDGIGVAAIMYILGQDFSHGPLRAIFTVDEEVGMTGAQALDAKYLEPIKYLVNCDSESYDVLTTSSAGGRPLEAHRSVTWSTPKEKYAYRFTVKDLCGGHSGDAINRGYANAVKLMGQFLYQAGKIGKLSLARLSSNKAHNVIPSDATVEFTSDLEPEDFAPAMNYMEEFLTKAYGSIETAGQFILEKIPMADMVMSPEDGKSIVNFINLAMVGVLKMSQFEDNLVELSANIAPVHTSGNKVTIAVFPRSAVDVLTTEIVEVYKQLAEVCGMDLKLGNQSPGWPLKEPSALRAMALEVFKAQNGFEMKAKSIHAGLETSYFYEKNPALDIISIGPNNIDIHSPKERLELATVAPHAKLIKGIIETVARSKK